MHLDHCRHGNLAQLEQMGNGWCWALGFYSVAEGWVVRTGLRIRSLWRLNLLGMELSGSGQLWWHLLERGRDIHKPLILRWEPPPSISTLEITVGLPLFGVLVTGAVAAVRMPPRLA